MKTSDSYQTESALALDEMPELDARRESDEVSLIEILTEFARRKRQIAMTTGIITLMGLVVSVILPTRYTAVTKLMPPQQAQSASSLLMSQFSAAGVSPLAAMAGGMGLKSPNDIYVGMLNSRPVADAIIQKFGLRDVYRDKDMTAARKDLAEDTQVASEKSGFISISVTDRDKKRSAAIANEYTEQLRLLTKGIAVTEASQRRLFYENQLKDAKEALIAAEASFEEVQQNRGLVQLDAQAKAMIESLATLRAQIAAKEVELQAMRSYSTDRNPDVEIAERELASMKMQAARLEQRNHSSSSGELGLEDVPAAGLDYLRADHEVKYRQALFDLLIKQYDAARLDEAKDAAIIQVVEPAIEPDRRSSPRRVLITSVSLIVGFLVGSVLALLQWWRNLLKFDPRAEEQLQSLKQAFTGRPIKSA